MKRLALCAVALLGSSEISSAQFSFSELYETAKKGIETACAGRDDCLRLGGSFAWFLWNNRDKADFQYNTVKCAGYHAVKRGYVWSPLSIWEDLTPTETVNFAIEVCDCVIGYWGKEPICRRALVEGNMSLLSDAISKN